MGLHAVQSEGFAWEPNREKDCSCRSGKERALTACNSTVQLLPGEEQMCASSHSAAGCQVPAQLTSKWVLGLLDWQEHPS